MIFIGSDSMMHYTWKFLVWDIETGYTTWDKIILHQTRTIFLYFKNKEILYQSGIVRQSFINTDHNRLVLMELIPVSRI